MEHARFNSELGVVMNFLSKLQVYIKGLGIVQVINNVLYAGGLPIAPFTVMTLSQLKAVTDFSTIDGYVIKVSNVHDISGGGGSLFLCDGVNNRAVLISNPIHYTSFAQAKTDFPLDDKWKGLRITYQFTNGELIELYNTGTGGKYTNKYAVDIYNGVFGTLASPTESISATSGTFSIPVLEFEAGFIQPGSRFRCMVQGQKTGTGGTSVLAVRVGTVQDLLDSPIYSAQITNTNPIQVTGDSLITVVDATHFHTTQNNALNGAGSNGAIDPRTVQFNTASKMYMNATISSANAADVNSLISLMLRLEKL